MLLVASSLLAGVQALHAQEVNGAAGPTEHGDLTDFIHRAPSLPPAHSPTPISPVRRQRAEDATAERMTLATAALPTTER